MRFEPPLLPATLVRRYKRFLADIRLECGTECTAHVANPGAMTGAKAPGLRIWVQPATNPKRKLKYSWILAESDAGALTGVDTSLANRLVREALNARALDAFAKETDIRPEQRYGANSRIDFLLGAESGSPLYLEVKNVHLSRRPGRAEFPDSVTARGTKHLHELTKLARSGTRAAMLFVVQRSDCSGFSVASDIDPAYAKALKEARAAGVALYAHGCKITPQEIRIAPEPLPILPADI